ncbi:F-box protein At4g00755-like [Bidens hawaiensis]|uniref:F-box protein At4g00755-like n=1 Tax=Bidens hawaiensis TaxID=980011 RepID=UPI00404A8610
METRIDFLQRLKPNMSLKILTYLDDSADLVRASAVSRHWQNIVVTNGLSKRLCVTRFPQLASITRVVKPSHDNLEPSHDLGELEHRAYASLFRALTAFPQTYCIADPVSASSTDNYPQESIMNTLDPRDKILHRYSYWSSKGSDDPEAPETLIYNVTAKFCVITEINLHPFQALFQRDFPIYSSKSARFRMGHPKSCSELDHDFMEAQECADDKFIWTYTSPVFPVARENWLQRFKLPEPVVCIGGFLQIELLGRVQKQAFDGKYYICVAHVQAIGRQLSPAFSVEFSEPSNSVYLKYNVEGICDLADEK